MLRVCMCLYLFVLVSADSSEIDNLTKIRTLLKELGEMEIAGDDGEIRNIESDAVMTQNGTKQAQRSYVTVDTMTNKVQQLKAVINGVNVMIQRASGDAQKNKQAISTNQQGLNQRIGSLEGSVVSLENSPALAKRVQRCLTGRIDNACGPYCRQASSNWPSGYTSTVSFNPPFKKTPATLVAFSDYDDHSGTPVRYQLTTSPNTNNMGVNLKIFGDSSIYAAAIQWMACA